VAEGEYRNPAAAEYVTRILSERRDKLVAYWFARVPPLDFFVSDGGVIRFHDLGVERHVFSDPVRYRARASAARSDRQHEQWTEWIEFADPEVPVAELGPDPVVQSTPLDAFPFLGIEVETNRGSEWSSPVMVYVARASGRVVAVEH
jgi:hypothetical protein